MSECHRGIEGGRMKQGAVCAERTVMPNSGRYFGLFKWAISGNGAIAVRFIKLRKKTHAGAYTKKSVSKSILMKFDATVLIHC